MLSIPSLGQSIEQRRAIDRDKEIEYYRSLRGPDADLSNIKALPRFVTAKADEKGIPDEWIVQFTWDVKETDVDEEIERIIRTYGGERFGSVTKLPEASMFAIRTDAGRAEQISNDASVRRVSQNVTLKGNPTGESFIKPIKEEPLSPFDFSHPPSFTLAPDGYRSGVGWNLDRLDSRPNAGAYNNIYTFNNLGAGTDIYLIDSGVYPHASEFGNRVYFLYNPDPSSADTTGHGTGVASIAAGQWLGVASEASIRVVRISRKVAGVETYITTQQLIDAMNLIRTDIASRRPRHSVVNLSVGYGPTPAFNFEAPSTLDPPLQAIMNGQTFVVAASGQTSIAGESLTRAAYWPNRLADVFCVGMTDSNDVRFHAPSNWSCGGSTYSPVWHVNGSDAFAPGGRRYSGSSCVSIGVPALTLSGSNGLAAGSSFASPAVAGIAAQAGAQQSTYYPDRWMVRAMISEMFTPGLVSNLGTGDSNRLSYAPFGMTATRNAASYAEGLCPDSIAVGFAGFGVPPTSVSLSPSLGNQTNIQPLAGATSTQVSYVVPSSLPLGKYLFRATQGGTQRAVGTVQINNISPGVFTTNQAGTGTAVAQLYLVHRTTGQQTIVNSSDNGFNWNSDTHDAYLVLYGTGFRRGSSFSLNLTQNGVTYYSGGSFNITYAGASAFAGQDQVNTSPLPLPLAHTGQWEFRFYVDGLESNRTTIRFN